MVSQPMQGSVTDTPYFNCFRSAGIGWLPACRWLSSISATIERLPSRIWLTQFSAPDERLTFLRSLYLLAETDLAQLD